MSPGVVREEPSPRMDRFERYLEKYRRPIYSYVLRLVGDKGVAEDLAQETFVRLYTSLDKIRDATASAWLYRVARNLVTDYMRRKRPVSFTILKGGNGTDEEDGPGIQFEGKDRGPDVAAQNRELQRLVAETLSAMSLKFREVLVLVDMQKLTHEAASEIIGCSVKTVSARLARAREFVANRLSRYVNVE